MKCKILIPIYKDRLEKFEVLTVSESLKNLNGFDCVWMAPIGLNMDFYFHQFGNLPIEYFPEEFFQSDRTYSKLLLLRDFYERFSDTDYLLICQTDAVVLRPDLAFWLSQGYDYIGAPWSEGLAVAFPKLTRGFSSDYCVRPKVGNGGLSLRRVSSLLTLLDTHHDAAEEWARIGNPEDIFFSIAAEMTDGFRMPVMKTAASFAIESDPIAHLTSRNWEIPFGFHGFRQYGPKLLEKIPYLKEFTSGNH